MITIDQKSFEVKETTETSVVGLAMIQKTEVKKQTLSEEVKKIFTKVC